MIDPNDADLQRRDKENYRFWLERENELATNAEEEYWQRGQDHERDIAYWWDGES